MSKKKTKKTLEEQAKDFAKETAQEVAEYVEDNNLTPVDISECETAIEEAMMDLIYYEPFYAELTLRMNRQVTKSVPTLAVGPKDNEIFLFINPYFFCGHNVGERIGFLKHECLHVVNNHFVRARDLEPQIYDNNGKDRTVAERVQDMTQASLLNQAMDYAINEYIPALPKKIKVFDEKGKPMVYPKTMPDGSKCKDAGKPIDAKLCLVEHLKEQFPQVQGEQNFEYYYRLLKQKQEEDQQNGKGEGNEGGTGHMVLDDHGKWHEGEMNEEQITEKVKEIVNKAHEAAEDRKAGCTPSEVLQAIDALNHIPKDWRQDIQRFVARSSEMLIEPCRKKRNRRYGVLYPGQKKEPLMHLVMPIDASGSVADEELAQFFAEIKRLHNMGVEVTIIEFDTQVNACYRYDPKKPPQIHGRGGTCFKPAFDLMASKKFISEFGAPDGIIFFTDGGCWESESELTKPRAPVLWALTGGNSVPISWGARTSVEVKKRVKR
jgi:predicted metal-dependent peptidase